MISRITPSEPEHAAGTLDGDTLEQASRAFRKQGALILEDVADLTLIGQAREAFWERYGSFCCDRDDVLKVGGRRFMITLKMDPPFDDPRLFANSYLLPILGAALDEDFVIGAFGVVCSLPSAPAQQVHDDGGNLFQRPDFDRLLPAAAITVGIPLREMNAANGTTALWVGSHRDSRAVNGEAIEPIVREGSCILWDFRLKHGGTPNNSSSPRPLLYLTYCRRWFIDHVNFNNREQNKKQKPLLASERFVNGLSAQQQRLLARALWD
jgi:ectoine hydroxylase-related dioxygenase (phytanoyl-CoA dioxygenase family)